MIFLKNSLGFELIFEVSSQLNIGGNWFLIIQFAACSIEGRVQLLITIGWDPTHSINMIVNLQCNVSHTTTKISKRTQVQHSFVSRKRAVVRAVGSHFPKSEIICSNLIIASTHFPSPIKKKSLLCLKIF